MAAAFDVMLMERRADKHVKSLEWQQYVLTSFQQNKPYNQLAAEILGADGVDPKMRGPAKFYLDREAEKDLVTREVGRMFFGIDLECAQQSSQAKALVYDGTGDEHYDVISAFIKSMRGSDPDATVYWLARMLEAGEDPRFIARRIAILASEDIGNADPQAIQVAAAAWELTERIGMPECKLTLSQAAIYMATAPKSNASAKAIWAASKDVREGRTIPVPKDLRDSHYSGSQSLGHGKNYVSPHDLTDDPDSVEYLGVDRVYYRPSDRGLEMEIRRRAASVKTPAKSLKEDEPPKSPEPPELPG